MNFLAHLYLSKNDDELLIGNFIADSVKGKSYLSYPTGIQRGIILHRFIDEFTDKHTYVKKSIEMLRPKYGKYSGVLVDIFYDHFLAANWSNFSPTALPLFADNIYRLLGSYSGPLPPMIPFILDKMKTHNWLVNYAKIEGINKTLQGMAQRTKFISNMELAGKDLLSDYDYHKENFNKFFPEIIQFVEDKTN